MKKCPISRTNLLQTPRFLASRLLRLASGVWELGALLLLCLGLFSSAQAAEKGPNNACLDCHSDKTLTKTNAAGKEISLFVDEHRFMAGVHKTNTCTSCHADITGKHPDDNLAAQPPSCAKCHEREFKEYATSIHGLSHAMKKKCLGTNFAFMSMSKCH